MFLCVDWPAQAAVSLILGCSKAKRTFCLVAWSSSSDSLLNKRLLIKAHYIKLQIQLYHSLMQVKVVQSLREIRKIKISLKCSMFSHPWVWLSVLMIKMSMYQKSGEAKEAASYVGPSWRRHTSCQQFRRWRVIKGSAMRFEQRIDNRKIVSDKE